MTGLERNSDVVIAASYAPLFVNDHDHRWDPNAIVFNASQSYGSPSYYNQVIWADSFSGLTAGSVHTVNYTSNADRSLALAVAVGRASFPAGSIVYVLKLVNSRATSQTITVSLNNLPPSAKLRPTANVISLGSPRASDKNSFEEPMLVSPKAGTIDIPSATFPVTVDPYTVLIVRVAVSFSDLEFISE